MGIAESVLLNLAIYLISSSLTSILIFEKWRRGTGFSIWQIPKTICVHFIILFIISFFISQNGLFSKEAAFIITLIYLMNTAASLGFRFIAKPSSDFSSETINDSGNVKEVPEQYLQNELHEISGSRIEEYTNGLNDSEKEIVKKVFVSGSGSFLVKPPLLPGINQGGLRLNLRPELINELIDLNTEFSGLYNSLSPLGFLIIKYIPCHTGMDLQSKGNKKRFYKISRAELWGRLHYCGFEVLNEIQDGPIFIVLAQKGIVKPDYKNPSEGTLIKLKRVGYKGRFFYAYKIRTMYPYSEFIQGKVYQLNSLSGSGKIQNDFRITPSGKYLRKYWIDELPQIINWLKGDIKLVGIRGMSLHYFNLYPEYYKKAYLSVKPGLIPPIFDESNDNFEFIIKTEYKYLTDYLISPFKTDLSYLFKTINNIVFKGIRGH